MHYVSEYLPYCQDYPFLCSQWGGLYSTVFKWHILCLDKCSTYSAYPLLDHCMTLVYFIDASFVLSASSTSLLFVFRIRAIFTGNRRIVLFFSSLWFAMSSSCILSFWAIHASKSSSSGYCVLDPQEAYEGVPYGMMIVFDTLVFAAISCRLDAISYSGYDGQLNWWKRFRGAFLPRLSRAVLQDGQVYYGCVKSICASVYNHDS